MAHALSGLIVHGRLCLERKVFSARFSKSAHAEESAHGEEIAQETLDVTLLEQTVKTAMPSDEVTLSSAVSSQGHTQDDSLDVSDLARVLKEATSSSILSRIRTLDLSCCVLCDDDLVTLANVLSASILPNCNVVCLRGCPTLGLGSFAPLTKLLALDCVRFVDIADTRFAGSLRFDLYEHLVYEYPTAFQKLVFLDDMNELHSELWHTLVFSTSLHSSVVKCHTQFFLLQSRDSNCVSYAQAASRPPVEAAPSSCPSAARVLAVVNTG